MEVRRNPNDNAMITRTPTSLNTAAPAIAGALSVVLVGLSSLLALLVGLIRPSKGAGLVRVTID